MTNLKINRAFEIAAKTGYVHNGPETRRHILECVRKGTSEEVLNSLTSKQLAQLLVASSVSFREGDLIGRKRAQQGE